MPLHVFLAVAVVLSLTAAIVDWRTGHIPHQLTFGALVLAAFGHFGVASAVEHMPLAEAAAEFGYSIAGAVLCALVPLFLYRQNAIGGGDVGLFAALGAVLHPMLGVEVQMYSFFAAAVLAPAKLAYEGKLLSTLRNAGTLAFNAVVPETKRRVVNASAMSWFRLGPCVVVGALLAAALRWQA
jgi:prepilin peptidase CpaA